MAYKRIAQLRTAEKFRAHIESLEIDLPFDEEIQHDEAAPLAQPMTVYGRTVGNRFTILPMEGWDGTLDGRPSELTVRRWHRFGMSGAKLIFGGEAVAVRHDGRANPNQLLLNDANCADIAQMRTELVQHHEAEFGNSDDLLIGVQLTHSGRFCRPDPDHKPKPYILYRHPYLDDKVGIEDDTAVMTDDEIRELIADFVKAAKLAQQAGFSFVDIKHCHGYLGHEFLSAFEREGDFGGSFENRTRFLREVVAGIREHVPGLAIAVRLSAYDWVPFQPGEDGVGEPVQESEYLYAFGGDKSGTGFDDTEPVAFLNLLQELDIELACISIGSPYYVPHIMRPAMFPPSDGYQPPEDPLVGVARHIQGTAVLKKQFPNLRLVGSGYSYLQEWLPHVAQYVVRTGMVDSVGLGRMTLSYPQLARDVLTGRKMQRKLFCRTFSDCTTGPRNHLISGCFPLDDYYKSHPQHELLKEAKKEMTFD